MEGDGQDFIKTINNVTSSYNVCAKTCLGGGNEAADMFQVPYQVLSPAMSPCEVCPHSVVGGKYKAGGGAERDED